MPWPQEAGELPGYQFPCSGMCLLCVREWPLMTPANHWLLEFLALRFSDRTLIWLAYVSLCSRAHYKCPYLEGNVKWGKAIVPSSLIIVPVYDRISHTLYLQRLCWHHKKQIVNECVRLETFLQGCGKSGVQESSVVPSALSVLMITFNTKNPTFNRVVIFQPSMSFALSIACSFGFG